jgi:hypothetical protein
MNDLPDPIDWTPYYDPDPDEMTNFKAQSRLEALGYTVNNHGLISGPDRPETEEETELINYLCDEWDYGYEPHPNQKPS